MEEKQEAAVKRKVIEQKQKRDREKGFCPVCHSTCACWLIRTAQMEPDNA